MGIGIGENHISTDVLVIGGGMAGLRAAIKAKEQGLDVTLADKGYVGKAGATHFAEGDVLFFRPERGHKLEEWLDLISVRCEYINNREWDEILLKESKDGYNDLVSWGVKFYEEDGKLYIFSGIGASQMRRSVYEDICMVNRQYAPALRKKALESDVRILDRIMFCDLLKQDGEIVGAVGFDMTSGDLYIFKARVTVIAAGGSSFKAENRPVHYATGDGEAMAYRAGAEITGKEFKFPGAMASDSRDEYKKRQEQTRKGAEEFGEEVFDGLARFPAFRGDGMVLKAWPTLNAEGGPVINPPWEAHCGRAPLFYDIDSFPPEQMEWAIKHYFARVGTAEPDKIRFDITKRGKVEFSAGGMFMFPIMGGSGIWPVNTSCATGIPGLYAAGNSCATMGSGSTYAGMGFGLNHAIVTGARAGLGAAEYASKSKEIKLDEAELIRVKKIAHTPVERKGGFSPRWVTQIIQAFTVPYFILDVKHGERLQAALTFAEFINNHLVPKLMAKDTHEWRMAYETKNIALHAEMALRASLFRTESRGGHFREDYPRRDDPTWLAWVKLKDEQGRMKVSKEPVPEKWWPDLSKPYQERYPGMFPME